MATVAPDAISAHLNTDDLPWAVWDEGVEAKMLRVSRETGTWVIINRFAPGKASPPTTTTAPCTHTRSRAAGTTSSSVAIPSSSVVRAGQTPTAVRLEHRWSRIGHRIARVAGVVLLVVLAGQHP
jgi:hypothetical protein